MWVSVDLLILQIKRNSEKPEFAAAEPSTDEPDMSDAVPSK